MASKVCTICRKKKPLVAFEDRRNQCKECRTSKYEYCRKKYYYRIYFGLTPEEYDNIYSRLFKKQEGKCYLCEKSDIVLRLDHNHTTGKIRKLLCEDCNLFTGRIEKDLDFVSKVISYIRKF